MEGRCFPVSTVHIDAFSKSLNLSAEMVKDIVENPPDIVLAILEAVEERPEWQPVHFSTFAP